MVGDLKARSFVFPSGGPLCLPWGGLAPGLKTLMVASAPYHLVVITLPTGLIDSCTLAPKVKFTPPPLYLPPEILALASAEIEANRVLLP